MTQISRPFQIALLAMGLFAAVWFFVLQGHSASTSGSGSSAPSAPAQSGKATSSTPAGSSAGSENATGAPKAVYHGAAPGVEGLTRAIAKAHGAVETSQQNAKDLEAKSAQAASEASAGAAAGASAVGSKPTVTVTSTTVSKGSSAAHAGATHTVTVHTRTTHGAAASKAASTSGAAASGGSAKSPPRMQATVEAELKQGKLVAILFWNPRASVDKTVQRELQLVGHKRGGKLAVHDARAAQVGSFGSVTREVQVYQTPTILIVNGHGQTTTVTGLTDTFAIEQAINEAKHP